MKIVGIILSIAGIIALILTGSDYANSSENFSLLGADITVSEKGSLIPLLISGGVFLLGLVILLSARKK